MQDTYPDESSEKTYVIFLSIILVTIIVLTILFFVFTSNQQIENPYVKTYQKEYFNISPTEAYDLINESQNGTINLTITDIRQLEPEGCSDCEFKRGHLPNTTRIINTNLFHETENITLVYSRDGEVGKDFCQELVGHVYGKIYNLEGGWEAWDKAGFYKETGLNEE